MSFRGTFTSMSINGYQSNNNNPWVNIQTFTVSGIVGLATAFNSTGEYFAMSSVSGSGVGTILIYYNSDITSTSLGSWSLQATITNNINNDSLGASLSFSDDGTYLVAGAPGESSLTGAAYVYTRSGTTWTQQQKLTASDGLTGDNFGICVSIDGSGTYIVIGAPNNDIGATNNTGAAYTFTRSGTTWTQTQIILESGSGRNHFFGNQLQISQDGNYIIISSDGYGATAPSFNNGTGAVYIYVKSGSTWNYSTRLIGTGIVAENEFGANVGINNDGTKIFVRARGSSSFGSPKKIWFYTRSGGSWSESQIVDYSQFAPLLVNYTAPDGTAWRGDGTYIIAGLFTNKTALSLSNISSSNYYVNQVLTAAPGAPGGNFGQEVSMARSANIAAISTGQGNIIYIYAIV